MKSVLKWVADDGSLHTYKKDAEARNQLLELETWYEDNKIYGRYEGCKIEWEDFIEWCNDNREKVTQILKVVKEL